MQKILILMSDTGGGHRASAQALAAAFHEQFPDRFGIEIVDLLMHHLPWPLNQLPKTYPFLSNDAPWLWKLLYNTEQSPVLARSMVGVAAWWGRKEVMACFAAQQPDLIISVHPLVQEMTLHALEGLGWRRPFVTVVTDLSTAHPLWFNPGVDSCYVATPYTRDLALRVGMKPEQVKLFGLPIRPAFSRPQGAKPELRQKLQMHSDLPAALLIGGGEGIGPVEEIAAALNETLAGDHAPAGQLVVICGRNKALQERLTAQPWRIPVRINGFVDNMPEWMAACDCIVTKAGPGTIAEALTSGLPIVLSGFIPGQEEGNLTFVTENGAGAFSREPAEIAGIVARWFGPERHRLPVMSEAARRLGHPQATFEIVESVAALLPTPVPAA